MAAKKRAKKKPAARKNPPRRVPSARPRRKRRNPSNPAGVPAIVVNPAHGRRKRRKRKNPEPVANPRKRRRRRARKNPEGGVWGVLAQVGLAVLGGAMGVVVGRVLETKATSLPAAGVSAIEVGGGVVGGGAAALLSPALGVGFATAMVAPAAGRLVDMAIGVEPSPAAPAGPAAPGTKKLTGGVVIRPGGNDKVMMRGFESSVGLGGFRSEDEMAEAIAASQPLY